MCKRIVGFTANEMAAGLDTGNFEGTAIKTEDGRVWWPTKVRNPMDAAAAGIVLGFKRGDKVCE